MTGRLELLAERWISAVNRQPSEVPRRAMNVHYVVVALTYY